MSDQSKDMTVEELSYEHKKFYEDMEYMVPIKINGEVVGITQFLFTFGIVCGLDETGYSHRYCYEDSHQAHAALIRWILSGDSEPNGYIKRKPERSPSPPKTATTSEVLK